MFTEPVSSAWTHSSNSELVMARKKVVVWRQADLTSYNSQLSSAAREKEQSFGDSQTIFTTMSELERGPFLPHPPSSRPLPPLSRLFPVPSPQNGKMDHFAFTRIASHFAPLSLSIPFLLLFLLDEVHHHKKEINRDHDGGREAAEATSLPPSSRHALLHLLLLLLLLLLLCLSLQASFFVVVDRKGNWQAGRLAFLGSHSQTSQNLCEWGLGLCPSYRAEI